MTAWPDLKLSSLAEMSGDAELGRLKEILLASYDALKNENISLDITRGKPSPEQLDLSNPILGEMTSYVDDRGGDGRNYYGSAQGLHEVRVLFSQMLGADPENVVIGTNSSLALMHDVMTFAYLHGVGQGPWLNQLPVKFLCPSPGYDRHFAICEGLGIEMIPVPLTGEGPDMRVVTELVKDPAVRGMWCVPQYSNPTGETYSEEAVDTLAAMSTGATDFRIFWDNAYAVHHLGTAKFVKNILKSCASSGNVDRAFVFSSTSKITFAGAGLGLFGSSKANTAWLVEHMSRQTIGPDKLNQLRHLKFLRDYQGIVAHMEKHRAIIKPKFDAVLNIFRETLGPTGLARWSNPEGGYFISLNVSPGTARRVVQLAAGAGVSMVPAGRTFPYGQDPSDSNLRIAPTYPTVEEGSRAANVIALCTVLAWVEKTMNHRNLS